MNTNDLYTEVKRQFDAAKAVQTQMADRYREAWGFYRGELPAIMQVGDIPARRVMWQAFESINPTIVALFTDTQKAPIQADADSPKMGKLAAAVTKALHAAVVKIDGYYGMMALAIKEILITGNQAALVGYDTKHYETDKTNFNAAPVAELLAHQKVLQAAGYNVESEVEFTDDGSENATVTGWIQGVRDVKIPVINLIAFKDFYLGAKDTGTASARYCCYAEEISQAEAVKRKYKKSVVEAGNDVDTAEGQGLDTSLLVAGTMSGNAEAGIDTSTLSNLNDLVTVYHHFWRGCYNSQTEKLYEIITTDSAYLTHKEVSYCPLVWGGMATVPDSAYSESLYDFTRSTQVASTRARRAIQRGADLAAYPERTIQDDLLKPQSKATMNESGPGKTYLVKAQNAVNYLKAPDMPQAMQVLNNEIDSDVESVIQGSAGQAQALEKNSNASGTAIALTQNKQELNESHIAKCIAETFIKPIYRIMIMVLQEMGNALEVDGVQVPFKMLQADMGLSLDIKTEYDRAQAAANLLTALDSGTKGGTLPSNVTSENQYNIYADYFRAATGQGDVSRWVTPPDQMPKPSPIEQKIKAVLAACELRSKIAETTLAEAKASDMGADTQKKLNDAAYSLAQIKDVLERLNMDKVELYLEAQKQDADAAAKLADNAIEQEKETSHA